MNMVIKLTPMRSDARLTLVRTGDSLTVNGEVFDFTALPDGATLPPEAIASDWFAGPVKRMSGALHITLTLPHAADAPHETRFPAPITLTSDGSVTLPPYETEATA